MRPLKWETYDIDGDGKEEVIFAERKDHFNFGIISVDDVPDAGSSSETWTMEFNAKTELYDQFLRSNVLEGPDGSFGGVVTNVDLDFDGLNELYAVNDNWSDGASGELIPKLYKYELVAGAWGQRWETVLPGIEYQNTWPILTTGDLDADGLKEIIWCPVNNFGTGNEDPPRIVVYEATQDSSETIGIDNGDGTLSPNAAWNMGVPASTNMRPFRGQVADIDGDGTQEFIFAERKNFYEWGVVSVNDIPNSGDGSETWTMEAAGANLLASMNLNLKFEDDSDIANWGVHDGSSGWTTVAHNPTAGVDSSGALELGDGGYAFLTKRPVNAKAGANFTISADIKTAGWATPETYKLYLIVEGIANTDSVLINSDSGFTAFTLSGVTTGDAGYITIAGGNTAGANNVWVDNLRFTLDDGSPAATSDYRDMTVIDQTIYMFDSDGGIVEIDGSASYTTKDRYQAYPGWSWLSANSVDIDNNGTTEIVTGDYLYGGSAGVWVLVPDADSLVGHKIADFSGNTATRITSVRAGYINADSLIDFVVGFRGTDEIYLVAYQGGDITTEASYAVSLLDKGVLDNDGKGQMDMMVVANIDGLGMDEVLYSGVPRGIDINTQPLTIGCYADTLTADATRRWDMVVANGKANFFNGSGNLQSVYYDGNGYRITKTQPGIVNGSFLSASATDVDGDGVEEIITGNWYDAKVNMLTWVNGAWIANEIADLTDLGGTRLNGGAVGDIDNDGNIDFVTGSRASTPNGQIYRVEYTGGDITEQSNWNAEIIDFGMNDLFTQYEVINISNLDDDAELEVLYTSDYARGPNSATDAPFPIVILDLQKILTTSIADVRKDEDGDFIPDNIDSLFVIKGVVTSPDFQGTGLEVFIQDETAGIMLHAFNDSSVVLTLGDLVQVSGKVKQYKGGTQFRIADPKADILVLGSGTLPTPIEISVDDLVNNGEKYEGSLVKVNAITKVDGTWPTGVKYGNFVFSDSYLDFTLRIDSDTEIDTCAEPTYPINSIGIVGQYTKSTPANDLYQLVPRYYSDIEQNVAAPPSPYFFFTEESHGYDGGVLEVTDSADTYKVSWHPAVDLNNEALIYQFVLLNPDDGTPYLETMSDNNGQDTTITPTGKDIIELIQASGTDSLRVLMTIRTVSTNAAEGIVASVDTMLVTFKDLATGILDKNMIPKEFFVDQNYPNPFNPTTTIQFGLPVQAQVNLIIYDILGREVVRLVDNQTMNAGTYKYSFNASKLASGTYIYRLQADKKVEVKKMLLLK
jgi:hypothetical protein